MQLGPFEAKQWAEAALRSSGRSGADGSWGEVEALNSNFNVGCGCNFNGRDLVFFNSSFFDYTILNGVGFEHGFIKPFASGMSWYVDVKKYFYYFLLKQWTKNHRTLGKVYAPIEYTHKDSA